MKRESAGRLLVLTCASLAITSIMTPSAVRAQEDVDTFVVRPLKPLDNPSDRTPAELLGSADVGERYCGALHCVVLAGSPARIAALREIESRGLVSLEPLPDAHRVFFRKSTYNARAAAFETDFPGREEVLRQSDVDLFMVIFKAFPEEGWIRSIKESGLTPLESLQTMAFLFYGPRKVAETIPKRFSYVYAISEVPAGLRRLNLDAPLEDGRDEPGPTTVVMVAEASEIVLRALTSIDDRPPVRIYHTGPLEAYTARLSRLDALTLSLLPEVVSISRNTTPPSPSDERYNRLLAGSFQSPGSSWTAPLPSNNVWPRYWDNYLTQLTGLGLNLNNQTIGFLDTGIDSGLQRSGTAYCPPYLRPPGYPSTPCALVFTADVTADAPAGRGDDLYHHGTVVTSVAAGFASSDSSGRDTQGYSFTHGVATGARVAVCQFFQLCGASYRTEGEANPFSDDFIQRMRYALVSLGSTVTLPDNGQGPGVKIINHSWNRGDVIDYEGDATLLDRTTRSLKMASFLFRAGQSITGPDLPVLHVVSAGNASTPGAEDDTEEELAPHRLVSAPGVAKNVITVGATETYNQESYVVGAFPPYCPSANLDNTDDPHQIAALSRIGFPNLRLKPDLVAPGTRAYGRRSVEYVPYPTCNPNTSCNMDLDGTGQYGWANGTSFAAPAVAGAAAITREWLSSLGSTNPSPALVKAALIATARSITNLPACSSGCQPCCASCGDVRPAPDKYQGFGAVSLDRFFRASSNYFRYDQGSPPLVPSGSAYTRLLTITDNSKDINIALAWTDRAGPEVTHGFVNLQNDLDLTATIGTYTWYGNLYYTSPDSCARNGYSLRNPAIVTRDHKNNVERITIKASDIPSGATQILLQVNPFSITGDGIDPATNSSFRQDFALFVENAR